MLGRLIDVEFRFSWTFRLSDSWTVESIDRPAETPGKGLFLGLARRLALAMDWLISWAAKAGKKGIGVARAIPVSKRRRRACRKGYRFKDQSIVPVASVEFPWS